MVEAKDFYEHGPGLQGHKCPAFDHPVERHRHSLAGLVYDACAEMVVEDYARVSGDKRVCIPCHEQFTGIREPRAAS
jgi:hypothetical protein